MDISGINLSGLRIVSPVSYSASGSIALNLAGVTGQYLYVSNNTAFDQNGAFTIECWVYPTTVANDGYIYSELNGSYLCLLLRNGKFLIDSSYVGIRATSTNTYTANSWYHVAVSSTGSTTRLFVNGSLQGTYAGTGSASGADFWIGNYDVGAGVEFNGYISNFRFVKGTALYTSAFTTPTSPLTAVSGTQLLLNTTDDTNFLKDSSTNNFTVVNNGTVTHSAISPFV